MRRTVIIVAIVIAAFVFSLGFDLLIPARADAACRNDDGSSCVTSGQYATGFREGELKNSRDRKFNARVKRKIERWYDNHPQARQAAHARGFGDWWKDPFQSTICIMWGGDQSSCVRRHFKESGSAAARADRRMGIIGRETTRLSVKCGGAAIIGAMGGRLDSGKMGWWGAGAGATSCLYQTLGDRMDWW